MTSKTKICLDTLAGGRALALPRQLVAGVVDGRVGVESTGVCGPRTEAARPALLTLVRVDGDQAARSCFFFFLLLWLNCANQKKLPGGGGFVHTGAVGAL